MASTRRPQQRNNTSSYERGSYLAGVVSDRTGARGSEGEWKRVGESTGGPACSPGEVVTHFLNIGLERIRHRKWRAAAKLENRPVDDIGGKVPFVWPGVTRLLGRAAGQQVTNQFSPPEGARISGWTILRQLDRLVRRQLRDPSLLQEPPVQPSIGMEVVVFQIQTFHNRIVPLDPFRLPERLE